MPEHPPPQHGGESSGANHNHKGGGVAADASFLESVPVQVMELHRNNLLRLQTEELLQECRLVVGSTSTATASTANGSKRLPSWTALVTPFVEQLTTQIQNLPLNKITLETLESCPFAMMTGKDNKQQQQLLAAFAKANNKKQSLKALPFAPPTTSLEGQSALQTASILMGRGSCALTKASGNANVLPTYNLTIVMPNELWDTKDYKNHRYFMKRNLVVWYVAQTLVQQKKSRSKVGTIYWTYERNDPRKPCLVVVPPTTSSGDNNDNNHNQSKKKRQKKETTTNNNKPTPTMKTPKFRIQIRFEMESIEWIPPLRLVPNRSNIAGIQQQQHNSNNNNEDHDGTITTMVTTTGSPMYNHALLEDAYHSFLPQHQQHSLIHRKQNDNGGDSDSDHEDDDDLDDDDEHYPHWADTVILLKVWCLQRGLLRAHDGFDSDQLALLVLYLYRTKQANARMAPLQVLAVVFKCLAQTRWFSDLEMDVVAPTVDGNADNLRRHSPGEALSAYFGTTSTDSSNNDVPAKRTKRSVLVMPAAGKNEAQTIAQAPLNKLYAQQAKENANKAEPSTLLDLYRRQAPGPVFLDSTLRYNYFGRLSPSFLRQVQWEATRSLPCLHSPSVPSSLSSPEVVIEKPFACLFMSPARFWDRFDLYFRIPLHGLHQSAATETAKTLWSQAQELDWGGSCEVVVRSMLVVLRQALGDRVQSMRILSTGNGILQHHQQHQHLDSDEVPLQEIATGKSNSKTIAKMVSPTGADSIVLGVSLNVDTCARIVDRGPPAEHTAAVRAFQELWGSKAELRRFKDGAIVQAVVWNTTKNEASATTAVHYHNENSIQGGIVERIIHHILHRHFLTMSGKKKTHWPLEISSPLRDMTSVISGAVPNESSVAAKDKNDPSASPWFTDPAHAHRCVMKTFDALSSFLKDHSLPTLAVAGTLEEKTSRLGIPLAIDAVEPLSPCLRYADVFPPIPHPFLGSADVKGVKKISAVIGFQPICIQIRFGASSKWPTDLKAIGAAKTAMLIQLANGIEEMKSAGSRDGFEGPIVVTPSYVDIGFRGYVFRVKVRADPEIRFLRGLFKPTFEAASLLRTLTREHIVLAMHHSMIHAIHTKHPSAGAVVRMAMRWVSGHMLSGLISQEAVELLVAKVYSDRSSPLEAPGSVTAGFLKFLQLLESHDWVHEPLIVDPHGHIDDEDQRAIQTRFEQARGPSNEGGTPLYIISPCDRQGLEDALSFGDSDATSGTATSDKASAIWAPSFAVTGPEWVVLTRIIALARKTRAFLVSKLIHFDPTGWSAAFHETTTSFKSYSGLLRLDPDIVVDAETSSTGTDLAPDSSVVGMLQTSYTKSIREIFAGPKKLRLNLYRNLRDDERDQVAYNFTPVDSLVKSLRDNFGSLALFFYNSLCPEVIAILWRPRVLSSHPFSVVASEFAQPSVASGWETNTIIMLNANDILREMSQHFDGMVTKVKVFQSPPTPARTPVVSPPPSKKRGAESDDDDDDSSSSDESSD